MGGKEKKRKEIFSTNSTHNAQGKCLIKQIMTPHPTPLLKEREKTQKEYFIPLLFVIRSEFSDGQSPVSEDIEPTKTKS